MPVILAIQEPGAAGLQVPGQPRATPCVGGRWKRTETEKKKCGSSEALDKTRGEWVCRRERGEEVQTPCWRQWAWLCCNPLGEKTKLRKARAGSHALCSSKKL